MVKVEITHSHELERALKRFKAQCKKEGILRECKDRKFYSKPSVIKRMARNSNKKK